jgi:hypothetical protein
MMTPEQALQILSDALQPSMQGRITRSGYVAIEEALRILAETMQPKPDHDTKS